VTGELTPEAEEFVERLDTFWEPSPSGEGIHLWLHGEAPYSDPSGHKKDGREIYSCKRYYTMTGDGQQRDIRRCEKHEIAALYQRVKEGKKLVQITSDKFDALMRGDLRAAGFTDHSGAVQSLLWYLATEYACDQHRMEQEFLKSRLYLETHWRDKWQRRREPELRKAIEFAKAHPRRRRKTQDEDEPVVFHSKKFTDFKAETYEWVWPDYLPLGVLLMVFAPKAAAKPP
jgi:primase-polymerase (primpol)-like protein